MDEIYFKYSVNLDKYFEINLIDFIKENISMNLNNSEFTLSYTNKDSKIKTIPEFYFDKYFISIEIATNKLDEDFYVCDFGFVRDEFKIILKNMKIENFNILNIYKFIEESFLQQLSSIISKKIKDSFFLKISMISSSNNKIYSISKINIYK